MLRIHLLFLFLMLSLAGSAQYRPDYQSNTSLSFSDFLGGINHIYVSVDDDFVQYVTDYPASAPNYAVSGLLNFLKAMGFEDVRWGIAANRPINYPSFCDQAIVIPGWHFKNNVFTGISLTFKSCNGDEFKFKYDYELRVYNNTNVSTSIQNICTGMYGYSKKTYNSANRYSLPAIMTNWTEENMKDHFRANGAEGVEGVYEVSLAADSKYKLGIVKKGNNYDVIYFSGATNYADWKEGEIKARLFPTATPTLFKTEWYMADKTLNQNPYLVFDTGTMNVVFSEKDKTMYLKLFPTPGDKVGTTPSLPTATLPLSGTGFAVTSDGLIVTTHQVIEGAKEIKVRGIKGDFTKTYTARLLADDKNNDLAILAIKDTGFKTLGTIPYMISSKALEVGSSVFTIGYPLNAGSGDAIVLSNGLVGSKFGFQGDVTSYQLSAQIQAATNGAPLFDSKGNLTGIIDIKDAAAGSGSYAIKTAYLLNLFDLMATPPKLPKVNTLINKTLPEKVKASRPFVYVIEVER